MTKVRRLPSKLAAIKQAGPWWAPLSGLPSPSATFMCPDGHCFPLGQNRVSAAGRAEVTCVTCPYKEDVTLIGWSEVKWRPIEYIGGGPRDGEEAFYAMPLSASAPRSVGFLADYTKDKIHRYLLKEADGDWVYSYVGMIACER